MPNQLQSFADALGAALVERGLDPSRPFSVAEIYQDFVPYRTHRDALGVEMNGDYEHLLLRLLSGEGDLLELQSTAALNQIRTELDSPNPNTGLYREFAAVDVKLVGGQAPAPAAATPEVDFFARSPTSAAADDGPDIPDFDDVVTVDTPEPEFVADSTPDPDPEPAFEPEPEAEPAPEPTAVAPEAPKAETAAGTNAGGDHCAWCRQVLPDRPNLNFCPFCGTDMRIVPCGSCGDALEPGWRFCISCGTEVASET